MNRKIGLAAFGGLMLAASHLDVAHQLTPEAYREQFGLGPDYPMAAPAYARQLSEMAKQAGLWLRQQARRVRGRR